MFYHPCLKLKKLLLRCIVDINQNKIYNLYNNNFSWYVQKLYKFMVTLTIKQQ